MLDLRSGVQNLCEVQGSAGGWGIGELSGLHVAAETVSEDNCAGICAQCWSQRLFGDRHADVVMLALESEVAQKTKVKIQSQHNTV